LADDSGLEVDFLRGAPGIYSARYAGSDATDEENCRKLLQALTGVASEDRGAMFRCVLVLYPPVFYLPASGLTVAQLAPEVKNKLSHRGQALELFKKWLHKH
jgi:XTP/dITP diphosphohydrolase